MITSLGHYSTKWPFNEHIKRYAVPLCALPTPHAIWNGMYGFKVETPIHDNIRELITWECKEHGVKS